MKRVLGWALVVLALGLVFGVWTGLRAQRESASIMVQAGLAIAMGCNLLLFVWLWSRARPGSGDAIFSPAGALLSAAMLVGILPGLLWPAASGLRIAGAIASIAMTVVSLNIVQRRRRSVRVGGRV